jgi:hypothetical protein
LLPLYLYGRNDEDLFTASRTGLSERRVNYSHQFVAAISKRLELPFVPDGKTKAGEDYFTPEDVFYYAFAVFHSPGYRSRYAEFLKIDFPRLPLTSSLDLFRALARLGGELTALHLLESPTLDKPITEFIGGRSPVVEKIQWSEDTVWVDKAKTIGFKAVPEEVWNFHIGGYQVCEKWLKDRKGRTLTDEDIAHYHKIVIALTETIGLMAEIDEVIDQHGGWPAAFASAASSTADECSSPSLKAARSKPLPIDLGIRTEDELPLG